MSLDCEYQAARQAALGGLQSFKYDDESFNKFLSGCKKKITEAEKEDPLRQALFEIQGLNHQPGEYQKVREEAAKTIQKDCITLKDDQVVFKGGPCPAYHAPFSTSYSMSSALSFAGERKRELSVILVKKETPCIAVEWNFPNYAHEREIMFCHPDLQLRPLRGDLSARCPHIKKNDASLKLCANESPLVFHFWSLEKAE